MTVPGLPAGYTGRRPTLGDAEAILAVVHAAERDALGRDDSTLERVAEHASRRETGFLLEPGFRLMAR